MNFSKRHGLGNDYLLVERAELAFPLTPERVRYCDYHFGVGSDGIVEVTAANGDRAEVVIWNPDGSTAELSGNGTRIAARWLARRSGSGEVRISVGPREVVATMRDGKQVEMDVGTVEVGEPETIDVGDEPVEFVPVSVGNRMQSSAASRSATAPPPGPLVENHKRFPERTNVQLVRLDGPHDVHVGVWERGAGDLSSGTSAVAVVGAAVYQGWCTSPVTVHLAGGDLEVALDENMNARLIGPAEEICRIQLSEELEL